MYIINKNVNAVTVTLVGYRGETRKVFLCPGGYNRIEPGWGMLTPVNGVFLLDKDPKPDEVKAYDYDQAYGIIKIPGHDTLTAAHKKETLVLQEGVNIVLESDPDTNTITINSVITASGAGLGDVTSVASDSLNHQIAVFAGTSGKVIEPFDVDGLAKLTDGVVSAAVAGVDYLAVDGSAASLTDFPTLNQNTTGTAANLSGTPALPDGTTATTQSASDGSTKLATTAYTDAQVSNATYDNRYYTESEINTIVTGLQKLQGVEAYGTLSFDDITHTFSVSSITYWFGGVKYVTASPTTKAIGGAVPLVNNTLYFFYFTDQNGALTVSTTAWSILNDVPVATVFWNGISGSITKETHAYNRDRLWHLNQHRTVGTRYYNGLGLTYPTVGTPGQLQIETGRIYDEDLETVVPQSTTCRVWYKVDATTFTNADASLPYTGTLGAPTYLDTDTYSLTTFTSGQFINYWVYATPDIDRSIYITPSHVASPYASLSAARAEFPPPLGDSNLNSELKLIYKFVYKGDGTFVEYLDYRQVSVNPAGSISSVLATNITSLPSGTLAATTVQSALEELDAEKLSFGGLLSYGGFYMQGINQTQNSAVQNTWYQVSSGSILATPLNGMTFATSTLTIASAGSYRFEYTMDVLESLNNKEVQVCISINDVVDTQSITAANLLSDTVASMSSGSIITVTANSTAKLLFRTVSTGTPNITVQNIRLNVSRVG